MREGWEIRKLGDICDILNGRNQRAVESPNGQYPIYGSGGIMGYAEDFICKAGTTIIGRKGTINKPLFVDCAFWNVDTAFGLQPKEGTNPRFLFYMCKSIDFTRYNKSTTLPSLVKSDLLKIDLKVPPLQEQEKIVAELDCLSEVIVKKKQQLEELDKLAQSIFYDMFGDPITNEKGWENRRLGEICAPKRSIVRASKVFKANDTIHYIDIASIDNSQALLTGTTPYVFAEAPSRAQQKVERGDVLVSLVRPNLRNIAMVESEDKLLVASSGFCVLRAEGSEPRFIKAFALSDGFTRYLTDRTSGANYPAVREEDIRGCSLGVPPLELQSAFAKKIEAIEKQKELVKRSIVETETLFNSRMDYWFN